MSVWTIAWPPALVGFILAVVFPTLSFRVSSSLPKPPAIHESLRRARVVIEGSGNAARDMFLANKVLGPLNFIVCGLFFVLGVYAGMRWLVPLYLQ